MPLPLLIGGITIAAISYGVKKYCEDKEDCLMDTADKLADALCDIDDAVEKKFDDIEEYLDKRERSHNDSQKSSGD